MDEEQPNPAFVCPISNEMFTDPVIAEDGQTYERNYIENWLRRNPTSPKTRQIMKIQNLKPNNVVKLMIDEFHRCDRHFKVLEKQNKQFQAKFKSEINHLQIQPSIELKKQSVNIEAFTCPLTKKIFSDPVFAQDGFTYERKAIEKWLQQSGNSPKTGIKLANKQLVTNHSIKGMIDLLQQQDQKSWMKLRESQQRFLKIFAPKINEVLDQQILQRQKETAQKLIQNWEKKPKIETEVFNIVKKKIQLNAYKMKENNKRFQVPSICEHFLPRKEILQQLISSLEQNSVVCLQGLVGVGKSQIAADYALNYSNYEKIIWLNAENQKIFLFQIQTLLQNEYPEQQAKLNESQLHELIKAFKKFLGSSSLVILDNLGEQKIAKYILEDEGQAFKTIITSRLKNCKLKTVSVLQFSEKQVILYLKNSLKQRIQQLTEVNLKQLSQSIGGLPLALSQIIAYISKKPGLSIEKYCKTFEEDQSKMLVEYDSRSSKNIYTSLVMIINEIRKQNNMVDIVLIVIGCFSADRIPINLCLQFAKFYLGQKKLSNTRAKKIRKVFECLKDYSLINPYENDEKISRINSLVQCIINDIHKKGNMFAENAKKIAQFLMQESELEESEKIHEKAEYSQTYTRVQQLYMQIVALSKHKQIQQLSKQIAGSLMLLAFSFNKSGNYIKQKYCIEACYNISKQLFGSSHPLSQIYGCKVGMSHGRVGNYEQQIIILQKQLQEHRKGNSDNQKNVIQIQMLCALGGAYCQKGLYTKSLQVIRQAESNLSKYEPTNIGYRILVNTTMGITLGSLNQYQKSRQCLEKALFYYQNTGKQFDNQLSFLLSNLGIVYGKIGEFKKQKSTLEKALLIQKTNFGKQNIDIAMTLQSLATAQGNLGNWETKKQLLQQAIRIFEKYSSSKNIMTQGAKMNYANCLSRLGHDRKNIIKILRECLQCFKKFYGENHEQTALPYATLAFNLILEEQYDQAIKLTNKALKIEQGAGQNQNKSTLLQCHQNLAMIEQKKKVKKPKSQLNEEDRFLIQLLSSQLQQEVQEMNLNKQRPDEIIKITQTYIQQMELLGGHNTLQVCTSLLNMSFLYEQLGDHKKKMSLLLESIEIFQEVHEELDKEFVAKTWHTLGNALRNFGDYKKAKSMYSKSLEIFQKILGQKHPTTVQVSKDLVSCNGKGNNKGASKIG